MSRRAQSIGLVVVIAATVAVRVAWIAHTARPPVGLIDPTFYRGSALDLAAGRGYTYLGLRPSAYYPVGYPAALGALVWVAERLGFSGPDHLDGLVGLLNVVLAAASVALVFVVARRATEQPRTALLAAALYGLWPNLVFHSSVALSETLFNALVLAALAVLVTGQIGPVGRGRLLAVGALIGASALVRPISLLLIPAIALMWTAGEPTGWRGSLRRAVLVGAAAVVVVLPWTVRNLVVLDAPVLISSNLGDNLCIGHHDGASGGFEIPTACFDDYRGPEDELRRNRELTGKALRYAVTHPIDEAELVARRAFHTFRDDHDGLAAVESYGADPFLDEDHRRWLRVAADGWYTVVVLLGVVGLVMLGRRRDEPIGRLIVASAVAAGIPALLFFGDPRFKVPVVPFLAIGAAVVLARLSERGAPGPQRGG